MKTLFFSSILFTLYLLVMKTTPAQQMEHLLNGSMPFNECMNLKSDSRFYRGVDDSGYVFNIPGHMHVEDTLYTTDSVFAFNTIGDTAKIIFNKDVEGKTHSFCFYYLESGYWVPYWQNVISYDEYGQPTGYEHQVWMNDSFQPDWRFLQTHNENGLLLSTAYHEWMEEWKNVRLTTYEYDDGNCEWITEYTWANETWDYMTLTQLIYNGNDLLISATTERYVDAGIWVNEEMSMYSYDDQGRMIIGFIKYWEDDGWKDNIQRLFSYGPNGKLINSITLMYEQGSYVNHSSYTNAYDQHGNYLTELHEEWNGNWENSLKWEYINDYENEKVVIDIHKWNGDWIPEDNAIRLTLFDNFMWQSLYTTFCRAEVYYSGTSSFINENRDAEFVQIYPNPAFNRLYITPLNSMDNSVLVTLYDRQGRKIREQQHSQLNAGCKISMDLSRVPSGLYFVKIASGDVLELEKIVVLH